MFEAVFKPLKIGSVTLPNRIVFPPFQTNYATTDGFVTDRLLRFYREIASGGTGLAMVGCIAVSADGAGATNVLRLTTDAHEAGCAELFAAIKTNGTVAAAQSFISGGRHAPPLPGIHLLRPPPFPVR